VQLAINCLAMYGITTGTTATTYSPNGTVLRWQMALFLVRQAADHGVTVPAPVSQGYTDIGGLPQATIDAINQVTQLGISKGTTSTTFSPNEVVTRWQMALFLHRLGTAAGITFSNTVGHNDFTDIGAFSAEIQGAINALADTKPDPEGHIVLGTGASLYTPNDPVFRWAMALFLTRVLAADGVVPPAGFRVTVTPTATADQTAGTARAYTATFKNADGTPYTGAVGVRLFIVSSAGVIDWDGAPGVDDSWFEAPTDGLLGAGDTGLNPMIEGFPGADGIVSFTVRHDSVGAAERVVPVAWEDLDNDNSAEIVGSAAPTEPFGVGGQVAFGATVATECLSGVFVGVPPGSFSNVSTVDKAGDRFEINSNVPAGSAATCSVNYDSNDLFRIGGVATDLAGFEAALNTGDGIDGTYAADASGQSTLDIVSNTDASLTITDPVAAGVTVNADTYAIKGTAVAGFTVAVYIDANNNDLKEAAESKVGETTAAADGTWTIVVPLTQDPDGIGGAVAVNNFVATQRSAPAVSDTGTGVGVPPITESAVGVNFTSTTLTTSVAPGGTLNPGDVITVVFSGDITGVGDGDTLSLLDVDGTTATLTCGGGGNVSCSESPAGTLVVTVNNVVAGSGGTTGGINTQATITAVSGFTAADGGAISLSGDRTFELA
jgi:hypothetical protein